MTRSSATQPGAKARAIRRRRARCSADGGPLLAWYDRHRRRLPWRAPPGERADPYRVWLSEIMLQQTTVKAVAPYYRALSRALADRPGARRRLRSRRCSRPGRASAITPARAICMPARGRWLNAMADAFPTTKRNCGRCRASAPIPRRRSRRSRSMRARLRSTAMSSAWSRGCSRSRRNCRPPSRHPRDSPNARPTPTYRRFRPGLMDLGATICTPKRPACALCPWIDACAAQAAAMPETLSAQGREAERPTAPRRGLLVVRADGAVLVRTRAGAAACSAA